MKLKRLISLVILLSSVTLQLTAQSQLSFYRELSGDRISLYLFPIDNETTSRLLGIPPDPSIPKGCMIVLYSQREEVEFFRLSVQYRLGGKVRETTQAVRRTRDGISAWTPAFFYLGTLEIVAVKVEELSKPLNESLFGEPDHDIRP